MGYSAENFYLKNKQIFKSTTGWLPYYHIIFSLNVFAVVKKALEKVCLNKIIDFFIFYIKLIF